MGLFSHDKLSDLTKQIKKKEYTEALKILKDHLDSEKKLMEDLAGLSEAVSKYGQGLNEAKVLLSVRSKISGALLEKKMEEVQKNATTAQAILQKLWRKDKKGLE